ncbi:ABC transporter substrate-binding protein [Oceanivirga salmonicida]|uniref:ABC transporter substrate-binding protein n=1 Tax=Oceanivirga salmonicida TaxID=1769291 RepID=UPI00082DB6CB|nr:ABC transporter substrate-binding protein [Oceanivirga salmonicida]
MKKFFKKIALAMTMGLVFVSCGSKEEKVAEEIPTLKVINIGNGKPENYDTWIQKVNEYVEPKIGAKLEVETISWGDWGSRRSIISTSNEPFDVLFGNNNVYYNDVSTGLFISLDDLLNKPEFKALKDLIPDKYWDGVRINGKIYAVPTYKDSSITQYFVIDKKYVDKFNVKLDELKTLPDLDNLLGNIKKETGKPSYILDREGATQIFNNYDKFGLAFDGLAVHIDDKEMKVVNVFEQADILKDLEYLHKWYKEGIINPDAATTTERPKYAPFFIAQGWPLAAKTVWGPQIGAEVLLAQYGPTIVSNGTIQGSLNSISSSSTSPEKALAFLQLINTDTKLRDMFAYGEEGVNFEYVEAFGEQRISRNDAKFKGWPMAAYAQGTFFNMTITNDVEENQWKEVEKLNEEAKPSVLLGFTFNVEPVQDEIFAVLGVYNKYKAELLTGVHEPKAKIAQMLEEMNKVGLQKIKEEAQKQIDEFKKTK